MKEKNFTLPSKWKLVSMADLAINPKSDIVDGPFGSNLKASEYVASGVPIVRLQNVKRNFFLNKNISFVTKEKFEELSRHTYKVGDILITKLGAPLGVACKVPSYLKSGVIVADIVRCRFPQYINTDYIVYAINSPLIIEQFEINTKGSTRPRVNLNFVRNLQVPLAPKVQQDIIVNKIEELFSHIDAGVEGLKQAKAKLQQYRQSVLKDAVTGKLTEQWREQNADKLEPADKLLERILEERRANWEAEQLKQFKEKGKIPNDDKWKAKYKEPPTADISLLPDIPSKWVWSTITQLGELNRGKSKHRPRNDPSLYGGDYPFVQTGDVRAANGLLTKYKQTYSEKGLAQSRLWPAGTMCITIAANIAETAILGLEACFPDSVVGFIPQNEYLSVEYIEFFFRTAKEDLDRYAPATAQKNINLAILETVAVPFMSLAEQQELVLQVTEKLDATNRAEATIDAKIKESASLKSSILAKAFAGELVPNNSSDNAQELLEKIKAEKKLLSADKPKANSNGKSKMNSERKPLLTVLTEIDKTISPEELMQEAGFTSADIDDFYVELASIAEKIEQMSPNDEKLKNWPYENESNVKIKLKD